MTMGPHVDDLHRMAVFARVVDDGSFSGAARSLGIAKSAVSRHVGLLEQGLGVRLLNRTTRKLHLTEAGESFYQSCRLILDEAEEAVRRARDLQDEMIGTLNMTVPAAFGRRYVLPHLATLLEAHPRLDLRLHFQDAYLDLVARGIDLAIRIGQLPDSSLVARTLSTVDVILCASPAYLARRQMPTSPQDLLDHPWLLYSLRHQPSRITLQRGEEEEITMNVSGRVVADDGLALAAFMHAGAGIGMLPVWYVADDIKAGRLVHILPEWGGPPARVYAV
ncbi:MAG: LysR family transcriptional regulator, partial [Myxococcales bacterium]|nr:LysR family transcriptional regulator [Myxococcales bacterium]